MCIPKHYFTEATGYARVNKPCHAIHTYVTHKNVLSQAKTRL